MKLLTRACFAMLTVGVMQGQGYLPRDGFVPNGKTAVRIAEAVLIPVYGEKKIESERPFRAILKGAVWTVTGTLHCPDGKGGTTTTLCEGGVATIEISKPEGHIISMVHYK